MTIVVGCLSWFYYHLSYQSIIKHGSDENQLLTTIFANSIWDTVHPYLESASNMSPDDLRHLPETTLLHEELQHKIRGTTVVKVKLYNRALSRLGLMMSGISDD